MFVHAKTELKKISLWNLIISETIKGVYLKKACIEQQIEINIFFVYYMIYHNYKHYKEIQKEIIKS